MDFLCANLMSINFSNMTASVKQNLLMFDVLTILFEDYFRVFLDVMPCSQVENYAAFAV